MATDAERCRNEDVIVVGGGNSAGQAAVFLAQTARRVFVFVRSGGLSESMSRYLIRRIEENPAIEVYEHATPTLVPLVEAGDLSGPTAEIAVADALAPLFGERDAAGDSIFPRPAGATIDTLLLGCTHYPLLREIIAGVAGDHVAIVVSATATASALAELLDINGLESGDGPDASDAGHLQLTTGDPATFHALAGRLFGSAFPDVERVELAVPAR
jgi:glutamate racemase